MILIRTDWPSFGAYLAALSRKARKNYTATMKRYDELLYAVCSDPTFPLEEVRNFMALWERQLIRGKTVQWAFPVETVAEWYAAGDIKLFAVLKDGKMIGMHFIQRRNGYWECHPPMYDKEKYPSLAKFMWFRLIHFAIAQSLEPLDFGGGPDDWREHIRTRDKYLNPTYKWIYVPDQAKRDPESEPAYFIERKTCSLLLKNS